jgi:cellulose synthase/poly-beta-1,6-N-acetylglucosamine synthase-like glycosyltransferase
MLPTLSVLIPAKNEEGVIGRCLESFLKSDYPKEKLEILVNVNGSSDNTYKIAKKYRGVKVIKTGAKTNRAEPLNELLDIAKGEIIGIFDADTYIEKDCLTQAVKRFSNKNVMGVGGLVKSIRDNMISKSISMEKSFFFLIEHILSNKMGYNSHFIGKNMFIRKNVFEEIGKLNPESFLDDVEFSLRMKERGYKIVFESKAITWEQEPSTVEDFYRQRSTWSRGVFKIKKLKDRNILGWVEHLSYLISFGITPLVLISALSILLIGFILKINIILPFFTLFFMALFLPIGYSRIMYNDPISDILLFPVLIFLNSLHILFIVPKTYVEELNKKESTWHDIKK